MSTTEYIIDTIIDTACRMMQNHNIRAEWLLLGWEVACLLRQELNEPELIEQLHTPVGYLTVIVDPYNPRTIKVFPGVNKAMHLVGRTP